MDSIFVIHWNEDESKRIADTLVIKDVAVDIEFKNMTRAIERIQVIEPSVILIYLTRQPPQGRKLAKQLRGLSETQSTPIIFVDGKEKEVKKARKEVPDAVYTTSSNLIQSIKLFMK